MNRMMTMVGALAAVTMIGCGAPPAVTASGESLWFEGFVPGSEVAVRGQSRDGLVSDAVYVANDGGSFVVAAADLVAVRASVDGAVVLEQRLERNAALDLLPVPAQDLCGGLPCPERKTPTLPPLPQDPVPLETNVGAPR